MSETARLREWRRDPSFAAAGLIGAVVSMVPRRPQRPYSSLSLGLGPYGLITALTRLKTERQTLGHRSPELCGVTE